MRTILRWIAALGRKAQEKLGQIEKEEALAAALKPGTIITLGRCRCSAKHEGTWRIDRYDYDGNDYRIIRCEDGAVDFAKLDAMEILT